jgi:hypothetical protein
MLMAFSPISNAHPSCILIHLQDHDSALALVTVHKTQPSTQSNLDLATAPSSSKTENPDLARAKDLISLHYSVKVAHLNAGIDAELRQARADVNKVLIALHRK